jgi:hypothetical protein
VLDGIQQEIVKSGGDAGEAEAAPVEPLPPPPETVGGAEPEGAPA